MKLNDWLDYLQTLPSGLSNCSLTHITNVAQRLGILDFIGKIVTVAGTNGKGSTVIFLESILRTSGYRVGAYISPHVLEYTERIRIDGKNVSPEMLCTALSAVANARNDIVLSYFEFTTLVAGVIFQQQPLDILLLEVGLGGRYDAVNIFKSDIAVITTVALDHTHILGHTRKAIGYAKAGIIRHGQMVVCGANMPNIVTTTARKLQAKLYVLHKDFSYAIADDVWSWWYGKTKIKSLPLPNLPIANAALALMVVQFLVKENFFVKNEAMHKGLAEAFLPGRWQTLVCEGKKIIIDVAHNGEATTLLAANVMQLKGILPHSITSISSHAGKQILAVVSMLQDKDIAASLAPLVAIVDRWYIGALPIERGASVEYIVQKLLLVGGEMTKINLSSTIDAALQLAIAECQIQDTIVIFGSFHTAAAALRHCMQC